MATQRSKVAVIVNSPSYDRVVYALTLALLNASLGREVHILFTYGAITRLRKKGADQVGEETEAWIRETVRKGVAKGTLPRISELLRDLKRFGGRIYACVSAMALHNLTRDELVEEVDQVTGLMAFLEMVEGAAVTLYI